MLFQLLMTVKDSSWRLCLVKGWQGSGGQGLWDQTWRILAGKVSYIPLSSIFKPELNLE